MERSSDKIISDCLEAIVGAIYLDGGLKAAEKFIFNFWNEYLLKSTVTLVDSKTKLQEFSLKKFKELPKYVFSKKTGPQHKPLFTTEVQIPNSSGTSLNNSPGLAVPEVPVATSLYTRFLLPRPSGAKSLSTA